MWLLECKPRPTRNSGNMLAMAALFFFIIISLMYAVYIYSHTCIVQLYIYI